MKRYSKNPKSKFAKQMERIRKANPQAIDTSEAEEMSTKWHGRDPQEIIDVNEEESYENALAALGELEELNVISVDMETTLQITFDGERPILCADGDKQLEIVGGDQRVDTEGIRAETIEGKRLVPLGFCFGICYETDKHHLEDSDGEVASYEHFFGEEYYKSNKVLVEVFEDSTKFFAHALKIGLVERAIQRGLLPMAAYNPKDQKILLVGGSYSIEDVGIVN